MEPQQQVPPIKEQSKKPYSPPELTVYGKVEDLTGWIGGPWGEFFNGTAEGWNPWGGGGDGCS